MTIASDIGRPVSARSFWLGVAAYLIRHGLPQPAIDSLRGALVVPPLP